MKTAVSFRFNRLALLTVVFGLSVSLIYFAHSHTLTRMDGAGHNGATASATAQHYHEWRDDVEMYRNWQAAGHVASLSAKNHPVGYSVNGSYSISAYVSGTHSNSGSMSSSFTLRIRPKYNILGIRIGKKGDSHVRSRMDFNLTSSPAYTGSASAQSNCDTVSTQTVRT